MLDTSFYNHNTTADVAGGVREGLTIGQMIRKNKRDSYNFNKQKEIDANQAKVKDIFKNNYKQGNDGKYSLDRSATMGELLSTDPQMAMKLQENWNAQDQAKIDRAASEQDRILNRKYKEAQIAKLRAQGKTTKTEKIKGDQFKVGGFAKRAIQANKDLANLDKDAGTGIGDWFQGMGLYPEMAKGQDRKLFEQSQRNFISAVLRRESGAAISDQEMENESMKYFPQPGDGKKVLEQKRLAREQAINNLRSEAGGAMEKIATAKPQRPSQEPTNIPGISNAYANDNYVMIKEKKSRLEELRAKRNKKR